MSSQHFPYSDLLGAALCHKRDQSEKDKPDGNQKKVRAPTTQFKAGKQDRRISKPDQFLPNWILMLMKTTKDKKRKK